MFKWTNAAKKKTITWEINTNISINYTNTIKRQIYQVAKINEKLTIVPTRNHYKCKDRLKETEKAVSC